MKTNGFVRFRIVTDAHPLARLYAFEETAQRHCARLNDEAEATGKGRPYRVQGLRPRRA